MARRKSNEEKSHFKESRSIQEEYREFKSQHALKRVFDPISELYWTYYDSNAGQDGDEVRRECLIFLHGICGTAGCYFYLLDRLEKTYRCISAQFPEYMDPHEWTSGFVYFLQYLKISKPNVFASDLSGYLLQILLKSYPDLLNSIILCNSYRRTDLFSNSPQLRGIYGKIYTFLPYVVLRNVFIDSYVCPNYNVNDRVEMMERLATEFMGTELDSLSASDLGSRITLQLSAEVVSDVASFPHNRILVIETNNSNVPEELAEDVKNGYEQANQLADNSK